MEKRRIVACLYNYIYTIMKTAVLNIGELSVVIGRLLQAIGVW